MGSRPLRLKTLKSFQDLENVQTLSEKVGQVGENLRPWAHRLLGLAIASHFCLRSAAEPQCLAGIHPVLGVQVHRTLIISLSSAVGLNL